MKKDDSKSIVPVENIEQLIYIIRGRKVILDQDLAALYGVETGHFNRAIKRNQKRFPEDFAFELTKEEWENLICQIGISSFNRTNLKFQNGTSSSNWGGRRKLPMTFTEYGVAMASNLLKSERAIEVSVEIVRAFIRLRHVLASHKEITKDLKEVKEFMIKHSHKTDKEFKRVWNAIDKLINPPPPKEVRRIGFNLSTGTKKS